MKAFVFIGPSLPLCAAQKIAEATYLPPAKQGDILRLLAEKPDVIGIVDGVFESQGSVWHNEILFALSRGVRVAGAASIGAIRAAELKDYGMKGIGMIYHAYARNWLEDDDEVAVLHAPAEFGWKPLTEAKVNLRATLRAARRAGLICINTEKRLARILGSIHYKNLTIDFFESRAGGTENLGALFPWIRKNWIDQKGRDAKALLRWIRAPHARQSNPNPGYEPELTDNWRKALEEAGYNSAEMVKIPPLRGSNEGSRYRQTHRFP